LAGVREAAALARLPAEEREAFGRFWADAAAVHAKVEAEAGEKDPAHEAGSAKDEGGRAIAFLEQTLERQKAKLGPDHPDTCQTMHSLALAYQNAGKLDKALPLLESVVVLVTAEFGPDHSNTIGATQNLAVAYWRGGRFDKSIPLFEKLLKYHEAAHGRQHLDTLMAVANLGVNYRDGGRLADAIPLLDEARRAAKEHAQLGWVTGELHAAYNLAFETWLGLADPALAAKRWPVLIRSLETEAGADHVATLTAMNNLGYALARSLSCWPGTKGSTKTPARLPTGASTTCRTLEWLAQLYEDWGKPDEAAKWRSERDAVDGGAAK
jgi:tetratricopeptide (TPR) repeat protein